MSFYVKDKNKPSVSTVFKTTDKQKMENSNLTVDILMPSDSAEMKVTDKQEMENSNLTVDVLMPSDSAEMKTTDKQEMENSTFHKFSSLSTNYSNVY